MRLHWRERLACSWLHEVAVSGAVSIKASTACVAQAFASSLQKKKTSCMLACAVQHLGLKENHRVGLADRRQQQA